MSFIDLTKCYVYHNKGTQPKSKYSIEVESDIQSEINVAIKKAVEQYMYKDYSEVESFFEYHEEQSINRLKFYHETRLFLDTVRGEKLQNRMGVGADARYLLAQVELEHKTQQICNSNVSRFQRIFKNRENSIKQFLHYPLEILNPVTKNLVFTYLLPLIHESDLDNFSKVWNGISVRNAKIHFKDPMNRICTRLKLLRVHDIISQPPAYLVNWLEESFATDQLKSDSLRRNLSGRKLSDRQRRYNLEGDFLKKFEKVVANV